MNSQKFIEINRDTWSRLQRILDHIEKKGIAQINREDLRDVGPLFRRVAANLSYAQEHYPTSDVVQYLNRLVARAHSYLYRTETLSLRGLLFFFTRGFPRLLQRYRRYIILSGLILLGGIAWGWALSYVGSPLADAAVPEQIRETVRQNAAEGDIGVKLSSAEKPLFSSLIMVNNIWVSFYCLVFGITWGIGTVFILLRNGLMVGALADIFTGAGQSLVFWSLILPHGIIELFAIILTGGAGLLLASALVRPGEYRRRDALVLKAKPAMLIAMGSIPLLIIAAIIEGFVTPLNISPWWKLVFAGFTAVLLGLYIYSGIKGEVREEQLDV